MYKSIAKILLFMLHTFYKKSLNNSFKVRKFHDNRDDNKTGKWQPLTSWAATARLAGLPPASPSPASLASISGLTSLARAGLLWSVVH